jgi:fermentation-respiration switch protein FrsA (DUF1100 family)
MLDRRLPGRDAPVEQAAYASANEPKELFIIDSGTHFDFYDKPD